MVERQRGDFAEIFEYGAASVGGIERLADYLGVEQRRVIAWLAGSEAAPLSAVMDVLDLITDRYPPSDWAPPLDYPERQYGLI